MSNCLWQALFRSPEQEDRGLRSAGGGPGERTALLPLPPGLEPRRVVESGGKPRPFSVARGDLRARQRLGFETQWHWSEPAVQRTAPALLGLFSLVTLFAHQHMAKDAHSARQTAWYRKPHPTFSDALAQVRRQLWAQEQATFRGSPREVDTVKVPREFMERLTEAVCYAA
jgi:hypothetical protein